MNDAQDKEDDDVELREVEERETVDEVAKLSSKLIYEVIRREGQEELARPARSLIWSGIAAGMLISFSVLGEAIFRTYLPDAPWRHLVENLGYSLGFLLVIIGNMQLFTENTITTVLPLMVRPTPRMLGRVARLWLIVLLANVVGAFAVSFMFVYGSVIPENLQPALLSLSEHAVGMAPGQSFFRAIPAGVLVAAIVWMLPQNEDSSFWIILTFTWLIAAGDFTHVVAGSVEMAYLSWKGLLGPVEAIFGFFLPVLAGNIFGGTVIFALMVWGQVKDEIDMQKKN
jgi:formate/nitrite transporter FocA (FNT family)